MYHRDVIAEVARRLPHQTRRDVSEVIEVLTEVWFEELGSGGDVVLPDIGRLSIEVQDMTELMNRYVGQDWEQRYDALANERERQQAVVYEEEAHGTWDNEPVWAGVRRTDDEMSAAGVYGFFKDREGKKRLQFRPVQPNLGHEEAERLAQQLKDLLKEEARSPKREGDLRPTLDFDI